MLKWQSFLFKMLYKFRFEIFKYRKSFPTSVHLDVQIVCQSIMLHWKVIKCNECRRLTEQLVKQRYTIEKFLVDFVQHGEHRLYRWVSIPRFKVTIFIFY